MIRVAFSHTFGKVFDLEVDIALPGQGFSVVFGPSGSGKTSLMHSIMGLEPSLQAHIRFEEQVWQDARRFVKAHNRSAAAVFQDACLFPHMRVIENLIYAARRAHASDAEIETVAKELSIESLLTRFPRGLSGGEQKRVAIARALLSKPLLLCMDEPLAGLDNKARRDILVLLSDIQKKRDMPVLYITHALDEVIYLADHLLVLQRGRVSHSGPALEVLPEILSCDAQPSSVIEVAVLEYLQEHHLFQTVFEGQTLYIPADESEQFGPRRVQIFARDVSISLKPICESSILNTLTGVVNDMQRPEKTGTVLLSIGIGKLSILAAISKLSAERLALKKGDRVYAHVKASAFV